MKANDKKMRAWQKIKMALGLLMMVFSIVACTTSGGGGREKGEIGGKTDLPYTKVGVRHGTKVTIGGTSMTPKSMVSGITKNNNGRVEGELKVTLSADQTLELDRLLGTTHFPLTKKIQKLNEFGFKVDISDPDNVVFENTAEAKITDKGIQVFDSRKEEGGSLITVIKYDAKVGDTYEYTDSKGLHFNSKVVGIDEAIYVLARNQKQRSGGVATSTTNTQKVKIYKTEAVAKSGLISEHVKKGEGFFCKEYGFVKAIVTLVSGEVIEIVTNPNIIFTGGGTGDGTIIGRWKRAAFMIIGYKNGNEVKTPLDSDCSEDKSYIEFLEGGVTNKKERVEDANNPCIDNYVVSSATYKIDGNKLLLFAEGRGQEDYYYSVSGDVLTIKMFVEDKEGDVAYLKDVFNRIAP